MKVLHIATFDHGGAGIAAVRLHRALLGAGIESRFLCMYSEAGDIPEHYIQPVARPPLLYRILNELGFPVTPNQKYWKRIRSLDGNYEMATLPFHDLDMSGHELVEWADVINLHFISFFIDIPSFFRKVRKPIAWTLHDMSAFLGCFHYEMDAVANRDRFGAIGQELKGVKREAYAAHPALKLITPSAWLMERSLESPVTGDLPHQHIRNCLDTEVFSPKDRAAIRAKHGLPADDPILLFVSEQLGNRRKGFDLLVDAFRMLDEPQPVLMMSIGKSGQTGGMNNHLSRGVIRDPAVMAELYAASDAFVLPSREDKLPNTMIESLSCGTPVIAFGRGGMADEIEDGVNGLLADRADPAELAMTISEFLSDTGRFNREVIRKTAVGKYAPEIVANQYIRTYGDLLELHDTQTLP